MKQNQFFGGPPVSDKSPGCAEPVVPWWSHFPQTGGGPEHFGPWCSSVRSTTFSLPGLRPSFQWLQKWSLPFCALALSSLSPSRGILQQADSFSGPSTMTPFLVPWMAASLLEVLLPIWAPRLFLGWLECWWLFAPLLELSMISQAGKIKFTQPL